MTDGVANDYLASSPVLVIGGATPLSLWDRGALQEMSLIGLLWPLTRWARTVHETSRLAEYTAGAFRQILSGKPGPVFLEMPMDVNELWTPLGAVRRTRTFHFLHFSYRTRQTLTFTESTLDSG